MKNFVKILMNLKLKWGTKTNVENDFVWTYLFYNGIFYR